MVPRSQQQLQPLGRLHSVRRTDVSLCRSVSAGGSGTDLLSDLPASDFHRYEAVVLVADDVVAELQEDDSRLRNQTSPSRSPSHR